MSSCMIWLLFSLLQTKYFAGSQQAFAAILTQVALIKTFFHKKGSVNILLFLVPWFASSNRVFHFLGSFNSRRVLDGSSKICLLECGTNVKFFSESESYKTLPSLFPFRFTYDPDESQISNHKVIFNLTL